MTDHRLNADIARPVVVDTASMAWQASPSPSVWRKRLELSGPVEAGRVTSIVRYARDSEFLAHEHPDGEEILVLEGTFSDQHGDYPAGSFLLNPEGFVHAPFSREGCVLLVKLRQYPGLDRPQIAIDTNTAPWQPGALPGVSVLPLYADDTYPETIRLVRFAPGTRSPDHVHDGGEEMFVLDGALADSDGHYETGCWARFPPGSHHAAFSEQGCTLYVKSGHLRGQTMRP